MTATRIAMTEDHPGVFIHYSAIEGGGFRTLYEGQQVEFAVEQGPKGLQGHPREDSKPAVGSRVLHLKEKGMSRPPCCQASRANICQRALKSRI